MKKKALSILLISAPAIAIVATLALLMPVYSMAKEGLNSPYFQFVSSWTANILPIMIISVALMGLGFYLLFKQKS